MPRHCCLQSKRFSGYPNQPACYIRHAAGTHELQLYGIDGQNHPSPCHRQELVASATMHPSQSAINCCMMAGIDSFPEMATLAGSPRSQVRATPKNSHDSTFPGKAEHGSQPKTATQTDYPANPSTHRIRAYGYAAVPSAKPNTGRDRKWLSTQEQTGMPVHSTTPCDTTAHTTQRRPGHNLRRGAFLTFSPSFLPRMPAPPCATLGINHLVSTAQLLC